MKAVILDGQTIAGKEDLHALLARELGFPAWYGGNLDALYDCLTDVGEEVSLTLRHEDALTKTLGPYAQRVKNVLEDAGRENPRFHFTVE